MGNGKNKGKAHGYSLTTLKKYRTNIVHMFLYPKQMLVSVSKRGRVPVGPNLKGFDRRRE